MTVCKRCSEKNCVKNGKVRAKQRWYCKACDFNFVEGDERGTWRGEAYNKRKPLAVLLSSLGLSFRLAAKIVNVSHTAVQCWFEKVANALEIEQPKPEAVEVITLDEMWHFIEKKTKSAGFGKQLVQTVKVELDCLTWLLVTVVQAA
jgi:transposase-like protein